MGETPHTTRAAHLLPIKLWQEKHFLRSLGIRERVQ